MPAYSSNTAEVASPPSSSMVPSQLIIRITNVPEKLCTTSVTIFITLGHAVSLRTQIRGSSFILLNGHCKKPMSKFLSLYR